MGKPTGLLEYECELPGPSRPRGRGAPRPVIPRAAPSRAGGLARRGRGPSLGLEKEEAAGLLKVAEQASAR
jgi:hypothetical protein